MRIISGTFSVAVVSAGLLLATGCVIQTGPHVIRCPPPPGSLPPPAAGNYQFQIIRQKAGQGDAVAQYILGSYYATGRGVPRSNVEAAKWYHLSAEQGYAPAQYRLGYCYATGRGVPWDNARAAKWYRLSAEQGYAQAQYRLGVCYALGRGVVRDHAEAVQWCRTAAEHGNVQAQNYLRLLGNQGGVVASPSENFPAGPGTGKAIAESGDAETQNPPLTVDEIKTLSSSGVKAETLIAQIKETNSKFISQDIAAAQQANPAVDPEVIKCMQNNLR
ncbi:MAG: tetratricopeptide repeat protein [Verrucomicrobiota bacterium]